MVINELEAIFRRNIRSSEGALPIGRVGRIRVHYFLDLLSACHDPHQLALLSAYFVNWLRSQRGVDNVKCVIGPKRGNGLFVRQVAANLGLSSAFIRDNVLFGRWIEGYVKPEDKVILVDDIASDGELLVDAISDLRKVGIFANEVFVLVDRKEGDAALFLQRSGVNYHFGMQLSDDDLADIARN